MWPNWASANTSGGRNQRRRSTSSWNSTYRRPLRGAFIKPPPEGAVADSVWQPILFHVAAVALGGVIVARGIVRGIERANKLLIPLLFALLVVAVARSVTLDGAERGLVFLFQPDLSALASYRTWLEALTQSAWSTGAGWGLILAYAVYVKREEDVVVNATAIGLGNNVASMLAGMAILPTAFALLPSSQALEAMAAGNTGLTFIWIPQLFSRVPLGGIFLPVFFFSRCSVPRSRR